MYRKTPTSFLSSGLATLSLLPILSGFYSASVLAQTLPPSPVPNSIPTLRETPLWDSTDTPYILGAGDRIQVEMFNIPEYSGDYQILVDGTISLPLIGRVAINNLTVEQAATAIKAAYGELLTDAIISVTLVGPRPLNVGVAGQVSRPGTYKVELTRESTTGAGRQGGGLQFPTLVEVLQLAEGITPAGDLREVQIRRRQPDGQDLLFAVNLWEFFQTGNTRQDLTLRDGDTIYVPTVNEIDTGEVRERAKANFSADINVPISVAIVGEVNRPGPYTIFGGDLRSPELDDRLTFLDNQASSNQVVGLPTVTRAIKIAGGITPEADLRNIQIRRRIPNGSEQIVTVNLWELLRSGDLSQDALLQEGDSIIIPKAETIDLTEASTLARANFAPNQIQVFVIGEVVSPGSLQLRPSTSLHEALLASGSFDPNRAKQGTVEFIRPNPDGTVSRRLIQVDFSQGLNPENNPTLQDRDVIVVSRSGYTEFSDSIQTGIQPWAGILRMIGDVFFTIDEIDRLGD